MCSTNLDRCKSIFPSLAKPLLVAISKLTIFRSLTQHTRAKILGLRRLDHIECGLPEWQYWLEYCIKCIRPFAISYGVEACTYYSIMHHISPLEMCDVFQKRYETENHVFFATQHATFVGVYVFKRVCTSLVLVRVWVFEQIRER